MNTEQILERVLTLMSYGLDFHEAYDIVMIGDWLSEALPF